MVHCQPSLAFTQSKRQMLHIETTNSLIPWCVRAAVSNVNFNERDGKTETQEDQKHRDVALRLSPMVFGLAAATLYDPDASSHRSDQGHCATDVCPSALFQA